MLIREPNALYLQRVPCLNLVHDVKSVSRGKEEWLS